MAQSTTWDLTTLNDVSGNHPIATFDPSGTPSLSAGVLTITDVSNVCWIDASDMLTGGWKFTMTVRDNAALSDFNTFFTMGYKSTKHKKSSFAVVRNPTENFVRLFNVCNFEMSDPIAQINVNDNAYHTISMSYSPSKPRKKLLVQVDGTTVCDCSGMFIDSIYLQSKPWVLLGTTGYTHRRKIYSPLNDTFMDAGNLSITNMVLQHGRSNYQQRAYAGAYSLDASNAQLLNTSLDTAMFDNNYTLACYVKRPVVNTQSTLLYFGDSAGIWRRLEIDNVGQLRWNYSDYFLFGTVPQHEIQSPNSGPNVWFHVALTVSGTTGKLFINGVEKSSVTIGGFTISPIAVDQFSVGGTVASGVVTNDTQDLIDNVAIWNSALTPSEVAAVFGGGHVDLRSDFTGYSSSANLVAFYSFENQTFDLTSNEYHLTGANAGYSSDVYSPAPPGLTNTKSMNMGGSGNFGINTTASRSPPYTANIWWYQTSFPENARIMESTGGFRMQFNQGGQTRFNTMLNATYTPPLNTWMMHTMVCDTNSILWYINGVLQDTFTPNVTPYNIDQISIGADIAGTQFLRGQIDEVSIHNSLLTAAEILAMYNGGTPIDLAANNGNYVSSGSLASWWRFEDNYQDSGSNGWNLTATTESYSTNVPT